MLLLTTITAFNSATDKFAFIDMASSAVQMDYCLPSAVLNIQYSTIGQVVIQIKCFASPKVKMCFFQHLTIVVIALWTDLDFKIQRDFKSLNYLNLMKLKVIMYRNYLKLHLDHQLVDIQMEQVVGYYLKIHRYFADCLLLELDWKCRTSHLY